MTSIHLRCPSCKVIIKAPAAKAGQQITCPRCTHRMHVPVAVAPATPPPAAVPLPAAPPPAPVQAAAPPPPEPAPAVKAPPPQVVAFRCPSCQVVMKANAANAGQKIACPKCGKHLHVPTPKKPEAAPPTVAAAPAAPVLPPAPAPVAHHPEPVAPMPALIPALEPPPAPVAQAEVEPLTPVAPPEPEPEPVAAVTEPPPSHFASEPVDPEPIAAPTIPDDLFALTSHTGTSPPEAAPQLAPIPPVGSSPYFTPQPPPAPTQAEVQISFRVSPAAANTLTQDEIVTAARMIVEQGLQSNWIVGQTGSVIVTKFGREYLVAVDFRADGYFAIAGRRDEIEFTEAR